MLPPESRITIKVPLRLSYLLACFAWLNTFALLWAMVFDLLPDRVLAVLTLALFFILACVTSSIQAQKG